MYLKSDNCTSTVGFSLSLSLYSLPLYIPKCEQRMTHFLVRYGVTTTASVVRSIRHRVSALIVDAVTARLLSPNSGRIDHDKLALYT